MATQCYKLHPDKKTLIPCTLNEYAEWRTPANENLWQIKVTKLPECNCVVSTVFLGLYGQLFETMVFAIEEDGKINWTDLYCQRYGTAEEAIKDHDRVVEEIKAKENDPNVSTSEGLSGD